MFLDFDVSSVTLFSLLNGDSILLVFQELEDQYPYPWVTRLYLYSFITFFVLSVLNIFIFLIEDAFQAARGKGPVRKRFSFPLSAHAWPGSEQRLARQRRIRV